MPLPRLRSLVKIVPQKHEGKDVFLAMDRQEGLFDHTVVLPPIAFVVAAFLDGQREAADVLKEILAQFKDAPITEEDVRRVVEDLDRHRLLESEGLEKLRTKLREEFLAAPARAAKFVPGTADEVRAEIDGYYAAEPGAGKPGAREAGPKLSGILAPHIDFRRGGTCYTHPYRQIAERSDADLYVVLGVAHVSPENPFVVTAKPYETAFGAAATDRDAVAALEKRLGKGIYDDEIVHRSEHSAEFQAVFLKHARPDAAFTVLPVLCSAFEPLCGLSSPSTVPQIEDFLSALREATAGRKVCFVGGVDFAHVGPVFGDPVEVDKKLVDWMMAGDTRSLQTCVEGNAEAFWNSVVSDGNARHVCGLSATYSVLRLVGSSKGRLLKYGFAPDPGGGLVSFAGMVFEEPQLVLP